jgi:hypothetical protein
VNTTAKIISINSKNPVEEIQSMVAQNIGASMNGGSRGEVPLTMGSNVARDILKRSSDFRDFACVVFEYIANAHESYQIDDLDREIHIDITKGAKGKVQIRDNGCGMYLESLIKFWTMHGETSRRENGLNLRGYNGTGKIAGYKYFTSMVLETVKDGLRNVTRLGRKHIEDMAKTAGSVKIDEIAVNEPTDFPNGTTVTLSNSLAALTTAQIIELRKKISMEMMMWMKGTKVYVNGELVEPEAVTYDETFTISSEDGKMELQVFFLDRGYKDEMQSIFINAGPVFIAAENYGKEGHRFSSKVHGILTTSHEWYAEHFEGRREMFVAEARDLKLKLSHPAAVELKEFAETSIRGIMKLLDEREKERQQKQLDERMKAMQDKLSRLFSNMSDRMNFKRRLEKVIVPSENPEPRQRAENPRDRKPKLNVLFKEFENDPSEYRVDLEQGFIEVNLKSPQLAGIAENKDDATWDQAVLEIVKTAFVEMEAARRLSESFGERSSDVSTYLRDQAEATREIRVAANTMLAEMYRGFQTRRQTEASK